MATLASQMAYDVANVAYNTADGAEATDYAHTSGTIRVTALWGVVNKEDLGQGFVADVVTLSCPVADLVDAVDDPVTPVRGAKVTRYPDTISPTDQREQWEVEAVRRPDPHVWEMDLLRSGSLRPVPR